MGKDNKPGSKGLGVGLAIGGFLLVAGIVAVVWALIAPANTHTQPTPVPSISTAVPSPQASASPVAKCGLDFSDMSLPDRNFTPVWQDGPLGVRLATLPGAGPCEQTPIAAGYTNTPKGALLAALNYMSLSSVGGPNAQTVLDGLLADGPDKRVLLEAAGELAGRVLPAPRLVGFHIFDYDLDRASIGVAFMLDAKPGVVFGRSLDLTYDKKEKTWRVVPVADMSTVLTLVDRPLSTGWTLWTR
ncbi:hypothetical protein HMPREF9237_00609 [Actinotignum schaalii FB123-CNA-2]|uniref:DUF8175 domain-containing protein n=3 Tax=Actinomycetaceae TaxID=2049 RepID=S2W3V1_9ACTO|nr:hypothetical protein HMPREF9237_00609 [Actinotignum schaalii FB123-CNA-2]